MIRGSHPISSKDPSGTEATEAKAPSKPNHDGRTVAGSRLAPGLTLVATPIGNLGDISSRALRALANADLVLCEDTRVSRKLTASHGISNRLSSYHEHNADRVRPGIIARLRDGARVVLISDAGTPAISDPGYRLVQACHEMSIPVSTVPGPTALIAALTISGLPTDRFYFGGFLPAKTKARHDALAALGTLNATLVHYESPRRLAAALADAASLFANRSAAVARELTKLHEEIRRGTVAELAEHYAAIGAPKGEAVLMIGPPAASESAISDGDLDATLSHALAGATLRDAVRAVAAETGIGRARIYQRALALSARPGDRGPDRDPGEC